MTEERFCVLLEKKECCVMSNRWTFRITDEKSFTGALGGTELVWGLFYFEDGGFMRYFNKLQEPNTYQIKEYDTYVHVTSPSSFYTTPWTRDVEKMMAEVWNKSYE